MRASAARKQINSWFLKFMGEANPPQTSLLYSRMSSVRNIIVHSGVTEAKLLNDLSAEFTVFK